ncbi:MAG: hypothetical protein K1T65_02295 [Candidatus Aramenus sp.]|nr:hypothetical protein [Candidatus Aramenus sp.]
MRCPSCGSANIVWTESSVVCGNCGLVIDEQKYDYSPPSFSEEVVDLTGTMRLSERTKYVTAYIRDRISNNEFNRRRFLLRVNEGGKLGVISREGVLALELIKKDPIAHKIYLIINEEGYLSGAKIKTRVAVSFYLSGYKGKKMKDILRKLNVNEKHFRRVLRKIPLGAMIRIIEKAVGES